MKKTVAVFIAFVFLSVFAVYSADSAYAESAWEIRLFILRDTVKNFIGKTAELSPDPNIFMRLF